MEGTMEQVREGGPAVVVIYTAVFGRKEIPVRAFKVGNVEPYAQYASSVSVTFCEPRKRTWKRVRAHCDSSYSSAERFLTVEQDGRTVYDSRHDVPIDMGGWRETAVRFGKYGPDLAEL